MGADIVAAHAHSAGQAVELRGGETCGCFHCLAVFAPSEIVEWVDEETTALCPRCGVDSVIGDRSGFPVADVGFLSMMKGYWFGSAK